ncbi:MAG: hypothetical protein K2I07_15200 [Lachnospiraceae bacterium]|nr:hypothetical protein [Lachnospiraceae bacterium]
MWAFVMWAALGAAFIVLGIYVAFSKKEKAFGFWANAKTPPVTDIRKYNRALGALECTYGVVFILIGLPLLAGQNSPLFIISVLGAMVSSIAAMVVYEIGIVKKYRA